MPNLGIFETIAIIEIGALGFALLKSLVQK